jgi:TonB family protein
MSRAALRAAHTIVRLWTRVYTWRLPGDLRERRLEEIESDLWEGEHHRSADNGGHAARVIARLLVGVPDDLGWRIEQEATMARRRTWMVAISGALGGLVLAAAWAAMAALADDAPTPPGVPRVAVFRTVAWPPPPPLPPPPPGIRPPASYSMIIYRVVEPGKSPGHKGLVRSVYPTIERVERLERQGRVVIRGTVDPNGRLTRARIERSIPAFDDAVLRILKEWPLSPATVAGRPVETEIVALARFRQ